MPMRATHLLLAVLLWSCAPINAPAPEVASHSQPRASGTQDARPPSSAISDTLGLPSPCRTRERDVLPTLVAHVCAAIDAVNTGNREALGRLMGEDFALLGVTGKYFPRSREQMIARWTQDSEGGSKGSSHLTRVFRVIETSELGLVSGEIEDRIVEDGVERCSIHVFTDTWKRVGTNWEWMHAHESGFREIECAGRTEEP